MEERKAKVGGCSQPWYITTLVECVRFPQGQLNIGATEVKNYTMESLNVEVQDGTNISQCCEYNYQILDKFCAVQRGVRTHTNGIRQKECNKHTTAALEYAVPCVPLFSHHVRRTLMDAPQCAAFCSENAPNCGAFGKKHRNSISGASRTNPEANHKSAAHCLIRMRRTNFTNCCILFDVRTYTVYRIPGALRAARSVQLRTIACNGI